MPAARPSFRPRPGGGFNPGMGQINEHLDENALSQAASQKAATQQGVNPSSAQAAALGQKMKQGGFQGMPGAPGGMNQPRPLGTLADELIKNPAKDIFEQLKSFFTLNTWLGIDPPKHDGPEETARKQKMHQRYQKLDQEQQQVTQRRYQEELQKKRAEEEQKARRKQQEEAQKAQQVDMPSSPQKGPVGPGSSKKQKAVTKLQNDRKTLSGPSSAN